MTKGKRRRFRSHWRRLSRSIRKSSLRSLPGCLANKDSSMYLCDSRFHVEALEELLENDSKWGFIIMCDTLPSPRNVAEYLKVTETVLYSARYPEIPARSSTNSQSTCLRNTDEEVNPRSGSPVFERKLGEIMCGKLRNWRFSISSRLIRLMWRDWFWLVVRS